MKIYAVLMLFLLTISLVSANVQVANPEKINENGDDEPTDTTRSSGGGYGNKIITCEERIAKEVGLIFTDFGFVYDASGEHPLVKIIKLLGNKDFECSTEFYIKMKPHLLPKLLRI